MAPLAPMTGPVYVDQPGVGNIRYGLFAAANGPFQMPPHGDVGGIQYLEEHCGSAHLWPAASCSATTLNGGVFPLDTCDGTAIGLPFQAVATLRMGPAAYTPEEIERRARIRLGDNAQYVSEQAFWGGNADVGSVLGTAGHGFTLLDVTPTPGTPVTIEYGIGLLEDALSQYSYPGILHCRPLVAPFAAERMLAPTPLQLPKGPTGVQFTPMGNVWSFGRGYSGNKPSDDTVTPAAGTAYIAATGAVTVWQDPTIYVNPVERSMDRSANQWQTTAQQAYAITVDCVAFFVLIALEAMTATSSTTPVTTVQW